MWLTLRATWLVLFVSVCAPAQTRTLALYSGSVHGLDPLGTAAMSNELQRLLAPANLEVLWKKSNEHKAADNDFELVAIASFEGSCAPQPGAKPAASSLADTSISDGRILPFFRVDCARVIQMLGHQLQSEVIGRALGRVIAHEIYHIVARTTGHHDTGVAKAAFSTRDLTQPQFEFDPWSLARMRPSSIAAMPVSSEDTGR